MKENLINTLTSILKVPANSIQIGDKLFGGMSNLVYKVRIEKKHYTVRIPGKNSELFVNRLVEKEALKAASNLGLLPLFTYFDVESGIKIAPYIAGEVLVNLPIEPYLKRIAQTLKKLHHSKIDFPYSYNLINRLDKCESYNSINEINQRYYKIKAWWLKLYYEKYINDEQVFCHGDAQRSNFVVHENETYLFDYEFSGMNSIYYDIASFANIEFHDAILLLEAYLERTPNIKEINHVRFYRIYQVLQWYQVALKKHQIGLGKDLNLDFSYLANKYLNWAIELQKQYLDKEE